MRIPLNRPSAFSAFALCIIALSLELGFGAGGGVASAHEGEEHEPSQPDAGAPAEEAARVRAQPGDWITLPETAVNPRDGRLARGTCPTTIGTVAIALGGHGHADPRSPDDAYGDLAGRWEPFAQQLQQRDLRVQFEVVCGTGSNENIEFFTSDWLPINREISHQEYHCPDEKPFLMATRCITSTAQ